MWVGKIYYVYVRTAFHLNKCFMVKLVMIFVIYFVYFSVETFLILLFS